jgi:hypothetical protein
MGKKRGKGAERLRGQLMLQISAGRYFRPEVPINERTHRRTVYTNAWFPDPTPTNLPVGKITGSTALGHASTAMIEVTDRLEAQRWDGSDDFMVATGGDDLIDDIAYVVTFVLNRTFSRNHDQVHRLVHPSGVANRREGAASQFPQLFDPGQVIQPGEWDDLKQFMTDLLELHREDFARVMRVIRSAVDATRRAVDDPTGAYTDLVASLESLGDNTLTTQTTWDRYDPAKRKIIDAALQGADENLVAKVRVAVLEADRAGLKRRFISSTLARVTSDYYRGGAVGTSRPPRSAEIERMLAIAYDIRSRRSHVLENLGEEAWVYTDGAETAFEPDFQRIFTLAGLWRLLRHVVRRYVGSAAKTQPEPWDYRGALPGIIQMKLAPQYWIWHPEGLDAETALQRFNGVVEAFIGWHAGHQDEGFDLTQVVEKIEQLVPRMTDGEPKRALVAIHLLWHEWTDPKEHRHGAQAFMEEFEACLNIPSPVAFTVGLLSNRRLPPWTPDEWAEMATLRRSARLKGNEPPLPAALDALIQLEAADQLETAGRHHEAVAFAANAVEESPGHQELITWESRLVAEDHDPNFEVHKFLFGKPSRPDQVEGDDRNQQNDAGGGDG